MVFAVVMHVTVYSFTAPTSRDISSYRVVSCYIVPCRVVSCRVVSCCVVPCRAVPCRVMPCRRVSCRVVPCRVVSRRVVSCPLASPRLALPRLASPWLASPLITSHHATPCNATRHHITSHQSRHTIWCDVVYHYIMSQCRVASRHIISQDVRESKYVQHAIAVVCETSYLSHVKHHAHHLSYVVCDMQVMIICGRSRRRKGNKTKTIISMCTNWSESLSSWSRSPSFSYLARLRAGVCVL